jgi:hypothetical protein
LNVGLLCPFHTLVATETTNIILLSSVAVLRKNGATDADLKPGFLLLAGCQSDLAKQAKGLDGVENDASREHTKEMKRLLQKVYGTTRVVELGDGPNTVAGPSSTKPSSIPTAPRSYDTPNKRARTEQEHPAHQPQAQQPQHHQQQQPQQQQHQQGLTQMQVMQREIQSLRDRNEHLTRKARKAEQEAAELVDERQRRRVLMNKLEEMERQLELGKQKWRTLEGKLQREIELVRRLENTLAEERQRVRELEEQARRNEPGLPLLRDLASMLQHGLNHPGSLDLSSGVGPR